MKDLFTLFEYQKFNPNTRLEKRIRTVNALFSITSSKELPDDILDVSAAGDILGEGWGKSDADKR